MARGIPYIDGQTNSTHPITTQPLLVPLYPQCSDHDESMATDLYPTKMGPNIISYCLGLLAAGYPSPLLFDRDIKVPTICSSWTYNRAKQKRSLLLV